MKRLISGIWTLIEKIVYSILKLVFRILGKELTEEIEEAFLQFVKFGIVGVSNTILSYVIYVVSLLSFRKLGILPNADYFVAQIIAFVLSVLWSFYWNNKMVFVQKEGKKRSIWKALLKTYVSYSFTGLFLSSILIVLWVQLLHIPKLIAPLLNLLISVPVNFLINKFWAFK
jgi:putative flippase GtrA